MKVVFEVFHPCYCSREEFLSIDVTGIEVIPRKGEIVWLKDFLPESATGLVAELIRDGGSWIVDQVVHHKDEIVVEL